MNNISEIMKNFTEVGYRVIDLENIYHEQAEYLDFLKKREEKEIATEFEEKDIEKKIFPEKSLKDAKSLIVFFFPYLTQNHNEKSNLSLFSQGVDYHIWVREEINKIDSIFLRQFPNANTYIQVDNGPLDEKFFGYISGLASLGENSLLIHEKYGSYGFLGILASDIKLNEFVTEKKRCSRCGDCTKSCPGKAIDSDMEFKPKKCSAYITQKKGELAIDEIQLIRKSGKIYGCDICQKLCPMNKGIIIPKRIDSVIQNIAFEDIDNISNKEFKKNYGNRSFSWRGKKILERNMIIIKGFKND